MCADQKSRGGFATDEGGATAVELALVLPALLTLLFGIYQFGWTQHTLSSIRYAMDSAARGLLIDPTLTQSQLQAAVTSRLDELAAAKTTVSLTKTDTANGRIATLSTRYVAEFGVPGLAAFKIPFDVTVTTALRATP
ncbi:MAG: TadE/TadG family type IV pilus assembly protein [Phenylobacterium sp.]|uniref:TadE/TadG family type IV pilus assembly protein n=1 Tax=Phenylobacterium sp. TaxID=1871053 RepID=UPI00391AF6C7